MVVRMRLVGYLALVCDTVEPRLVPHLLPFPPVGDVCGGGAGVVVVVSLGDLPARRRLDARSPRGGGELVVGELQQAGHRYDSWERHADNLMAAVVQNVYV